MDQEDSSQVFVMFVDIKKQLPLWKYDYEIWDYEGLDWRILIQVPGVQTHFIGDIGLPKWMALSQSFSDLVSTFFIVEAWVPTVAKVLLKLKAFFFLSNANFQQYFLSQYYAKDLWMSSNYL